MMYDRFTDQWFMIHLDADAVIQQFYPGELGGLALAEIVFGAANPSGAFHQHRNDPGSDRC